MEATDTQIWCDICQAGFGVCGRCFSPPAPLMFGELNSGQPGVTAPTHAERVTQRGLSIDHTVEEEEEGEGAV